MMGAIALLVILALLISLILRHLVISALIAPIQLFSVKLPHALRDSLPSATVTHLVKLL